MSVPVRVGVIGCGMIGNTHMDGRSAISNVAEAGK